MKLQATINGEASTVEVRRDDNGKLIARVDDREYNLEVSEPEPGVFLFKRDGQIFEATVSDPTAAGEPTKVRIGSSEFDISLTDPRKLRSSGTGNDHEDGLAEIRTAMPGKVVRLLIEPGTEVEKGDGVMVVEAMKMQNELKSPKTGRLKQFRVAEGDTVAAGDILATIE